jgi:diguanylate cyclase (GGDEF)-like protein
MFTEIAQTLTESIDDITRKWVDDLRQNTRTEIHKQLLSADIVDGVKAMLASLAQAIQLRESPDGETVPMPVVSLLVEAGNGADALRADALREERPDVSPWETHSFAAMQKTVKTTRPLGGPLSQARQSAAALGSLRHRQGYEIQEVLYEYVKLRQGVTSVLRSVEGAQSSGADVLVYVNRLIDELMLTSVENFYNSSLRDLEKRAIRDPLTQLYNKDYFHQRLNEEMRRAIRYGLPLAVAVLDMDHLKTINDTFGHQVGDEAIRAVAEAIVGRARQSDVPCRYGGDEFTVILPETTKAQAKVFAERVLGAMADLSIVVVPLDQGQPRDSGMLGEIRDIITTGKLEDHAPVQAPAPTISIGIAAFPEDARNPETLLAKADAALYRAKHEGRNQVAG